MSDEETLRETVKNIRATITNVLSVSCHSTALPLSTLPSLTDQELRHRLAATHYWDGAAVLDGKGPIVALRLYPEARPLVELPDEGLKFLPFGWPGAFGALLTISTVPWPAPTRKFPPPRIFIHSDAEELPYFMAGQFRCVFY